MTDMSIIIAGKAVDICLAQCIMNIMAICMMDRSMPATRKRSYARYTIAAVNVLGNMIQLERKSRRMTAQELAGRLGVTRGTVQRLEQGDPKVELGVAFEACTVLGIRLFDDDLGGMTFRNEELQKRLTLLPKYARPRKPIAIDDDF
ncbi:helix-turn-helix transcriptional regulator [Rhizobium leguminosarum]